MKLYIVYISTAYPKTPTKVHGGPRWEEHTKEVIKKLDASIASSFSQVLKQDDHMQIISQDEMAPKYNRLLKYTIIDIEAKKEEIQAIFSKYDKQMANVGPEFITIQI